MLARLAIATACTIALAAPVRAQQAQPAPAGPNVGEMAPDFSGPAANKTGPLATPIRLADLKGKTVVLAFFPRARTSGCTTQMEAYRDQYATLFNGGKDVVVIGISTDADTTLSNWAKEKDFPFQFVSDTDKAIGMSYGTLAEGSNSARRFLYVIGPDGRIVHTAKQFNPFAPKDYTDLGEAVKKAVASGAHSHH